MLEKTERYQREAGEELESLQIPPHPNMELDISPPLWSIIYVNLKIISKRCIMKTERWLVKKAYQDRDYQTIIDIAENIPEATPQEEQKLLMWYDQAITRTGGE